MAEPLFRPAAAADLPAIWAVYQSVLGQPGCTWSAEYPEREDLDRDLAAGGLYVLTLAGQVVAAASLVPENELDELSCWRCRDGRHRELARVAVLRACQGRGYAKLLLSQLLPLLAEQGCTSLRLLVAIGNLAARKTYEALSFRFLDTCRMYGHEYEAGERELG